MCDKTNAEKHKKYIDFYLGKCGKRFPSYDEDVYDDRKNGGSEMRIFIE